MTSGSKTVYIEPGFGEGPWHRNRLYHAFQGIGYDRVDSAAEAELIVSHSAGCFFLPKLQAYQQTVLVGPPFWPGKPLPLNFLQKEGRYLLVCLRRQEIGFWLHRTFWNCVYILRDIPKAIRIKRSAGRHDFYNAFQSHDTAIIRNQHDAFCTPKIAKLLEGKGTFRFYLMPGEHDDIWLYPERHARFISQLLTTKDI